MYQRFVTREEVKQLQPGRFTGEVMILDRKSGVPGEVIREMKNCNLLGFDTETRPSFKKGRKNKLALLQFANDQKAYLIRCNQIGIPGPILDILRNPEILKVGVAIRDDIRGLQKFTLFEPRGFIELQDYVSRFGIENNGLRGIAANVLKIKISKSQQLSNWENNGLTDAQVIYAATDAWACHQIYQNLSAYEDD